MRELTFADLLPGYLDAENEVRYNGDKFERFFMI